jgi:acyl-CoA hydrolase
VAIDENGRPTDVPALLPETEEEVERFKGGERRRAQRIAELKAKK